MAIAKGYHPMSYHPVFRMQDYTLRPPKNEAELVKLHQLGTQLFGEMVWPLATIQAWIGEYAYGCLDLFHHDKPIGSFDMWPLQASDIEALAADEVEESSLRPVRLSQVLSNHGHDHWYIASLMLSPEHRDHQTRRCFSQMICMALNNMADGGLISFPAQISAVGYSPEGEQLLEHVGLRHDPSAKITWGKFYRHTMPTRHDFFWPTIRTTGVEQLVEPLTTLTS
jgi:hypothetical protein